MAITMARIQMRRGLSKDFDPSKMTAGEWAVSIDGETENQIVWMCFSPGVVKRMGTLEDFKEQIRQATDDIRQEYENTLNAIKQSAINETNTIKEEAISQTEQVRQQAIQDLTTIINEYNTTLENLKQEIQQAKESVDQSHAYISTFENELKTVLIPKIESYLSQTEENAKLAERWAIGREDIQESLTDNSKYYSEQSKREYEKAKQEADRAEQYSSVVVPKFHIDYDTMELIQENDGKGIEFTLENGELSFQFIDKGVIA